jgi:hypothetical protein
VTLRFGFAGASRDRNKLAAIKEPNNSDYYLSWSRMVKNETEKKSHGMIYIMDNERMTFFCCLLAGSLVGTEILSKLAWQRFQCE